MIASPSESLPLPEIATSLPAEVVFPEFSWREGTEPESLSLNPAGFMEDQVGNWYMVRKARQVVGLTTVQSEELFNGPHERYWNSTEGRGLYFANFPDAVTKLKLGVRSSNEPSELYICRVKPDPEQVLDVTMSLRSMDLGQRAAALLLRSRSIMPGIPSPSRKRYDQMYGDAEIVTTPPLAMSRLLTGNKVKIGTEAHNIRWAVVRNTALIDIVAHRPVKIS